MLSRRRVLIGLGATFVLALAIVNVATGKASAVDMALYAAPFMAVVALLLSGRYVGEERILAVYRTQPRRRRSRAGRRWPTLQEQPFSAGLERAPWSLRGPPACAA